MTTWVLMKTLDLEYKHLKRSSHILFCCDEQTTLVEHRRNNTYSNPIWWPCLYAWL